MAQTAAFLRKLRKKFHLGEFKKARRTRKVGSRRVLMRRTNIVPGSARRRRRGRPGFSSIENPNPFLPNVE